MTDLGPMRRALAYALRSIPEDQRRDVDAAAYALARHYAQLIDDAAVPKTYADALDQLQVAAYAAEGTQTIRAYRKIAAALSATMVASDLGPKLLTALTALGLTPDARKTRTADGGVNRGAVVGNTIDELRARRTRRDGQRGASTVDSAAPTPHT